MKKKIMIVEDHEEMQILYKAVFKKEHQLEIIALEDCAEDAMNKIPELKPDLIIVDITLPGMSGIEFTKYIHQKYPHIKILVVTAFELDKYKNIAKEAGANNLATKLSVFDIVKEAVRLVQ